MFQNRRVIQAANAPAPSAGWLDDSYSFDFISDTQEEYDTLAIMPDSQNTPEQIDRNINRQMMQDHEAGLITIPKKTIKNYDPEVPDTEYEIFDFDTARETYSDKYPTKTEIMEGIKERTKYLDTILDSPEAEDRGGAKMWGGTKAWAKDPWNQLVMASSLFPVIKGATIGKVLVWDTIQSIAAESVAQIGVLDYNKEIGGDYTRTQQGIDVVGGGIAGGLLGGALHLGFKGASRLLTKMRSKVDDPNYISSTPDQIAKSMIDEATGVADPASLKHTDIYDRGKVNANELGTAILKLRDSGTEIPADMEVIADIFTKVDPKLNVAQVMVISESGDVGKLLGRGVDTPTTPTESITTQTPTEVKPTPTPSKWVDIDKYNDFAKEVGGDAEIKFQPVDDSTPVGPVQPKAIESADISRYSEIVKESETDELDDLIYTTFTDNTTDKPSKWVDDTKLIDLIKKSGDTELLEQAQDIITKQDFDIIAKACLMG